MKWFDPFVIPFLTGVIALFSIVVYKWVKWFRQLSPGDRGKVRRGVFTKKSLASVGEVFRESLLHLKIFKVNPVLGYMHSSLALGWFLLIVFGFAETAYYLRTLSAPPQAHIFFKYFEPSHSGGFFPFMMDLLLLYVLSGVLLAYFKRIRSSALGVKKPTKHTPGDRIALWSLWLIFPLRLLAESATSGAYGTGGFLTGSLGAWMATFLPVDKIAYPLWWAYSVVLMAFFFSMPFSRYMHIFTEVPLIFLRRWGVLTSDESEGFAQFQLNACSRCGICIDPCQMQSAAGVDKVQSVYFLRDVRYDKITDEVSDNCMMCGRCEVRCPVGLDLNALRLKQKTRSRNADATARYGYLAEAAAAAQPGSKVGYFAGCMTLLTPAITRSMHKIFEASGDHVWWADRDDGVCCGRPLKLSGERDAAQRLIDFNKELFVKNGITTLVTSCPICLKVFNEDYDLQGITVLHHSQYINDLIRREKLRPVKTDTVYAYHDPCELGRGSGIYETPREVVASAGVLATQTADKEHALCCGGSVANTRLTSAQQNAIGEDAVAQLTASGAEAIVTGCPLCKKSLGRNSHVPVLDLAEVIFP